MPHHYPQPDYLERRAHQRSNDLMGQPLRREVSDADKRRRDARREIERRREQKEAQQ
ncbi:MAG: hypothetical protein HYZ18_13930 [Pseudogulbenkiania sp.]|nr:hypothetical protein [Pseudogulbenkiania sp.]